jgi:hypothetical protein
LPRSNVRSGASGRGLYYCNECKGQFTVTMGTVFEPSKVPLNKWWVAAHQFNRGKNGASAHEIHCSGRHPDARNTDIVFAVVAGFPSNDQKYELEEKNHIGKFKRIVVCQPDPSSYDPALLCLRTNEPLGFDPDGMSGGSAFVVQAVGGEFHAYFAGVVVTGGQDRCRASRRSPTSAPGIRR